MTQPPATKSGARLRLAAVASILLSIIWSIAPGKIQPDTKFNLIIEPWQYLGRALFAWNDQAGLGELQNQAYGYLFPMGPVFGIAELLNLPDWAGQRLWWSIIVLVGFFGAHRLAVRLGGFNSDFAIVVALVYVLSPRLLSVLAQISIEAWPASVAPWLILAATRLLGAHLDRRSLLRNAAVTVLLVTSLGGVNATASLAVLLLPFLWLLTAPSAARRWRALAWWLGATALGAFWWLIPLFVLGRYGYPFLDYIETARITTAVTSLPNVLRGANHWIAYILDAAGHPVWQGGWVQAQYVTAIVTGCILAAAGILGLLILRAQHGLSHRARFLFLSLMVGLILVSLGYGGALASPVSEPVRIFLDGIGSPLRNVHKFDPLVRLPIAWGFGYALWWLFTHRARWTTVVGVAVAIIALLSPTALWVGRVGDAQAVTEIPNYWRDAAAFVDQRANVDGGSTLVLPHARSAEMTWGKVSDEPLTVLASSPVAIRAAAPLGHPGGTRILDAIDDAVGTGTRYAHLAELLNRMGISRIVVRDDVSDSIAMNRPELVQQSLALSPGFHELESFGDHVHVWSVQSPIGAGPHLYAASSTVDIAGVSEVLLPLLETEDLDAGNATVIDPESEPADIRTDSFRWQMWNSGLLPSLGTSELLPAGDLGPLRIGARPLPPLAEPSTAATRHWRGVNEVRVSSSAADPFGSLALGSGYGSAAALDGDARTSWWSDLERESWFALVFDEPTDLGELSLKIAAPASYRLPDQITIDADGTEHDLAVADDGWVAVDLSNDEVSQLMIEFPVSGAKTVRGISEITSSTIQLGAGIALGAAVDLNETDLVLTAPTTGTGAVLVGRDLVSRKAEGSGRQSWQIESVSGGDISFALRVSANPGGALERLLDEGEFLSEHRTGPTPKKRPGAAFDGDPRTQWVVPAGHREAMVTISWEDTHELSALDIAAGAESVRARVDGKVLRFSPLGGPIDTATDTIEITFTRPADIGDEAAWVVPETTIVGAPQAPERIVTDCEVAQIDINEKPVAFRLNTSAYELQTGAFLPLEACAADEFSLSGESTRIDVQVADWLQWSSVKLSTPSAVGGAVATAPISIDLQGHDATESLLEVSNEEETILAMPHGFNEGWLAKTSTGERIESMVLDGWQQGFVIPAGTDTTITVRFAPQRAHIAGLIAGPIITLAALLVLLFTRRNAAQSSVAKSPAAERRADRSSATAFEPDRDDDQHKKQAPAWLTSGAVVAGTVLATGFIFADLPGLIIALVLLAIPRDWLATVATAALVLAGVLMSALGVVDHASAGALLGQGLGLVTVLALVRWWFVAERESIWVFPRSTTTTKQERASR